jgi:hypothetical protein
MAGLATLALAGPSSGAALASGRDNAAAKAHPSISFTLVKITVPDLVKYPHQFTVRVHGHAAKPLTLNWWLVAQLPCRPTEQEEANVRLGRLKYHFRSTVHGKFDEERRFSTADKNHTFESGTFYACAYLSDTGRPVANEQASWRVERAGR